MTELAPTPLLWLDLETSGLDPETDDILEVGAHLTTLARPFELVPPMAYQAVLSMDRRRRGRLEGAVDMDPFVLKMHTENGLLDECGRSVLSLGDAERRLTDLVARSEENAVLAGFSVHFDLSFLRAQMPKFARRLSHKLYDVSAVKLFARSLGMPELPKNPAHRAYADVLESVAQARACADWFRVAAGREPNL